MNCMMLFGVLATVLPLAAAEFRVDPATLRNGAVKPELKGAQLLFQSTANTAAAALVPGVFDFSKGGSIRLTFSADAAQSNRYPRLLDAKGISLQGIATAGGPMTEVKLLLASADNKRFDQVILPIKSTPGKSHTLLAVIDPGQSRISLSLDGAAPKNAPLTIEPAAFAKAAFVMGATALKDSTRGFNGSLADLVIQTGISETGASKDPAVALPVAVARNIDLTSAGNGEAGPVRDGDTLRFKATANRATSAVLPGRFDFSRGVRLELEFQTDPVQTNAFPRLLEAGGFSLHFESSGNSPDLGLKLLLTGPGKEEYAQIIVPVPYKAGAWHKLTATIEPTGNCFSLQLDNGEKKVAPLQFSLNGLKNLMFVLGSRDTRANGNRGFNGAMRNLVVTAPFDPTPSKIWGGPSEKPLSVNGEEIHHFPISLVKNRHHAFPGAAKLPNGDLAVVFREGEAHVCPYGRICIVFSKDGGKNWSAPVAIADTASDERDPSIHTLPDGRVLVTFGGWNSWMFYANTADQFAQETAYIRQAGPEKFGGSRYMFSRDNGQSWETPIRVPGFSPHGPLYADGNFYQPSLGNDNGKRQVYLYKGSGDAKSWDKPVLVGESAGGNAAVQAVFEEPHTALLPDGRMVTAIRVPSDGYMRISFSSDKGQTWSVPEKTPVRGFPQHLLVLKDGRLMATYGYRYYPYGIRACFSKDGGKTWELDKEVIIQDNGINIDLGYPVSLQREDGRIFTVYYHITRKHPTCFIEGAIWKP